MQFYGFVLPAVLGVSLRSLPVFFRRPPMPARRAWLIAGGLALGTVIDASVRLLFEGTAGVRIQQIGVLLIAAATFAAIAHTGVWRTPERLRPSARAAAILIQTAYVWLAGAMLWLAVDAALALRSGRPVPPAHADAVRHLLALGTFTTLVFGMGQLVLPWLAMRRQRPTTTRVETWTLWLLITAATALRVTGAVLEARGVGAVRYWPMAAGGVLALTAVAFFALTVLRAAHAAARDPSPGEQSMTTSSPDPIAILLAEHETASRRFAALEQALAVLSAGDPAATAEALATVWHTLAFLEHDLEVHIRKEEEPLFPLLKAALPADDRLIDEMVAEHDQARLKRADLRAILEELCGGHDDLRRERDHLRAALVVTTDRPTTAAISALRRAARAVLQTLRVHFQNEEELVFPLAPQLLTAEQLAEAGRQMIAIDQEVRTMSSHAGSDHERTRPPGVTSGSPQRPPQRLAAPVLASTATMRRT